MSPAMRIKCAAAAVDFREKHLQDLPVGAGDVHVPVPGLAAGMVDCVGEGFTLGIQPVEDGHRGPFLRQPLHAGMANADGAAGHDAGLAFDSVHA